MTAKETYVSLLVEARTCPLKERSCEQGLGLNPGLASGLCLFSGSQSFPPPSSRPRRTRLLRIYCSQTLPWRPIGACAWFRRATRSVAFNLRCRSPRGSRVGRLHTAFQHHLGRWCLSRALRPPRQPTARAIGAGRHAASLLTPLLHAEAIRKASFDKCRVGTAHRIFRERVGRTHPYNELRG